MLGVVFTEFVEMVEDKFSMEMADSILESCNLASGGSYTAVGSYDAGEILALVTALSEASGIPIGDLVRTFGKHLFGRLVAGHPAVVQNLNSSLDLLVGVENHIHIEVRKLYPNAELPSFQVERHSEDRITMHYDSSRPLAVLALGLIEGCAEHFNETLEVEHIDTSEGTGCSATFHITRVESAQG